MSCNRLSPTGVIKMSRVPSLGILSHSQQSFHSSLTWTLSEVVEAAVLGPDAVLVAVACPINAVHPPIGGQTAQVSSPAAFPRTTSSRQLVLSQSRKHQQQTGKLNRGSHHGGVRLGETLSPLTCLEICIFFFISNYICSLLCPTLRVSYS